MLFKKIIFKFYSEIELSAINAIKSMLKFTECKTIVFFILRRYIIEFIAM